MVAILLNRSFICIKSTYSPTNKKPHECGALKCLMVCLASSLTTELE